MGAKLLTRDGWDWTFRAVRYEWAGRYFFLPPLYPIFLSLFAIFSNMAVAAQVGQLVLGVASIGLVYELGRLVHSVRVGLLAAAVSAVWFSSVITAWFYQETLYVPLLLLAFVLYLRAESHRAFGLAGAVFGLAALTRSMPLYFLPFLIAFRVRRAPALVLGFAAVVLPYSAALSRHLGEPTLIENHGGIILLKEDPDSGDSAGAGATLTALLRSTAGGPLRFVEELYGSLRSVLHVNGGRLLQTYIGARDRTFAVALEDRRSSLQRRRLRSLFASSAFRYRARRAEGRELPLRVMDRSQPGARGARRLRGTTPADPFRAPPDRARERRRDRRCARASTSGDGPRGSGVARGRLGRHSAGSEVARGLARLRHSLAAPAQGLADPREGKRRIQRAGAQRNHCPRGSRSTVARRDMKIRSWKCGSEADPPDGRSSRLERAVGWSTHGREGPSRSSSFAHRAKIPVNRGICFSLPDGPDEPYLLLALDLHTGAHPVHPSRRNE